MNGFMAEETVHSIDEVVSWLQEANRAMIALLLGCGLRRSEVAALTLEHTQQRDRRWCIVDLVGKHGRVRTIPVPAWVKVALDAWTSAAGIASGYAMRPISRGDHVRGDRLSEKVICQPLRPYAKAAGVPRIAPPDLRLTFAKLCRAAGGELEQIQLLLGHASRPQSAIPASACFDCSSWDSGREFKFGTLAAPPSSGKCYKGKNERLVQAYL